jgi:hypothetical protein
MKELFRVIDVGRKPARSHISSGSVFGDGSIYQTPKNRHQLWAVVRCRFPILIVLMEAYACKV